MKRLSPVYSTATASRSPSPLEMAVGNGLRTVWVLLLGTIVLACGKIVDTNSGQAQADLRTINKAVNLYVSKYGVAPEERVGLAALVPEWLSRVPLDPWGSAYQYRRSGPREYAIYSLGRDRRDDGGAGDDIRVSAHPRAAQPHR